jgi:hypothetical protein
MRGSLSFVYTRMWGRDIMGASKVYLKKKYLRKTCRIAWLPLFLCFAAAPVTDSNAASIYTNFGPDGSCAITFYGDINLGDEAIFDMLTPSCNGGGVLLRSNGGNLVAGLRIGELIREKGLETAVSYDAVCASACALAWLGGVKRKMFASSLIGFHQAYTRDGETVTGSGLGNALIGSYMSAMGLPVTAIVFAVSAKPDEMAWLNYFDAVSVGVAAELLTARDIEWIEAIDGTTLR